MPLADVADALTQARPVSRWRMDITERPDGVLIINDAYNANPESMRAALETLATVAASRSERGGRSFAVLGEMAELGADAPTEHELIGRRSAQLGISHVIAVGEAARPIERGAALEGSGAGDARWVPDVEAAVELLRSDLRPGDAVLVKASRAASLERVALAIVDDAAGRAGAGGDET
jgi:UDP-N-acetylmuramoyl-tripeptide--D-alanyl-D-alanine ligase